MVETGLKVDVKTYIIMSPTIYGLGSGFFHTLSIQVPTMIREALKAGQAEVIGNGKAYWDHVNISDLVLLYEVILASVIAGKDVPSGEKGIFFSETGEHTWLELSQGIAKAGLELKALKSTDVRSITLPEGADKWGAGNVSRTELGFASKYVLFSFTFCARRC